MRFTGRGDEKTVIRNWVRHRPPIVVSLTLWLGLLAGSSAVVEAKPPQSAKQPNILWLSCEDISPNLGCYGDQYAITPNLDRMASQGVLFNQAFVNAPVCSPSRTGIITGVYPQTLGAHFMYSKAKLPAHVTCFTKLLRAAGYYCTNKGKEDYLFFTPKDAWDESSGKAHWRKRKPGQPFFAVFNYVNTHQSQSFANMFGKLDSILGPAQRHDPAKAEVPPYLPDTPLVRRTLAHYHDCITVLDGLMASRLQELDDAGLTDDTIVFFWSDHGWGMPRGKMWLHDSGLRVPLIVRCGKNFRHLMPENLANPGTKTDQLVSLIDLAPTLLNLAGVQIPGYMQGEPFLGPNLPAPRRYIYGTRDRVGSYFDIARAVRDHRYKYIRNYLPHTPHFPWNTYHDQMVALQEMRRLTAEGKLTDPAARLMEPTRAAEELYDTLADPHEVHNLVNSPNHREILERLRKEHVAWMMSIRDMGLLPEGIMQDKAADDAPFDMARREGAFPRELIRETALLADRGSEVLPEIQERLTHPDAAVRWWAVVALIRLGDKSPATVDALTATLKDASPSVRITAARALWRIDPDAHVLPTLTEALKIKSHPLRLRAVVLLHDMGEQARPALPEIRGLMAAAARDYTAPPPLFVTWVCRDIINRLK
jgi:arylsulfatase A-like enzyme